MKKISKITLTVAATLSAFFALAACTEKKLELSKSELADKIKGGWAGQIIGCTYGGPTEFRYRQKMIPDDVKINWDENRPITTGIFGGLYDDLYLDITFMDVFERFGFDAPRIEFQRAVGDSTYELWAANRALRALAGCAGKRSRVSSAPPPEQGSNPWSGNKKARGACSGLYLVKGGPSGVRTLGLGIKSPLLCQLS